MSLNFNFTKMIDRLGQEEFDRITDNPFEKQKWHPVTDALIWGALAIDMGEITEKNADEFADRMIALQAVQGHWLVGRDGETMITRQDVKNHIGMVTNVATKGRPAFAKKLMTIALDVGKRMERKQDEPAYERLAKQAQKTEEV